MVIHNGDAKKSAPEIGWLHCNNCIMMFMWLVYEIILIVYST